MQEKYSLKWETYSDHLKSMIKDMMINEDFSDVTLVTEDKKHIKANRNILSACSPVLKDIFQKERHSSSTTMYLMGIQYSEMESIMQYIYLGEATFYVERMEEFLAVAKSLEIKELGIAKAETNDKSKNEPPPSDPIASTGHLNKETKQAVISYYTMQHMQQASKRRKVDDLSDSKRYECGQCNLTFAYRKGLKQHKKSVHEGVRYACDQCDYEATLKGTLTEHIHTKHDGVKYACKQCDYQFTKQSNLTRHIQSMHEGVKYTCDQCDYQFTQQGHLTEHIQSKHEGVKYACGQCNYKAARQGNLNQHIL